MPLDTTFFIVAAIICFAAAVKITFGVGFALLATPLLLFVMEPDAVIGVIAPLILLEDVLILAQTWRYVPWRSTALLAASSIAVAPFASLLLVVLEPRPLQIAISVIILVVGVSMLTGLRLRIRREPVAMTLGGAVSGLFFPLSGVSGPPVALLLVNQQWEMNRLRALLASYLVALESVTVAVFLATGVVDGETLMQSALLLPSIAVAAGLSALSLRCLNPAYYPACVTVIVVSASLLALVNLIWG